MFVKKNTVIPVGFKVTYCPPGQASGRSIYQLEREHEERLMAEAMKAAADKQMAADKATMEQRKAEANAECGVA